MSIPFLRNFFQSFKRCRLLLCTPILAHCVSVVKGFLKLFLQSFEGLRFRLPLLLCTLILYPPAYNVKGFRNVNFFFCPSILFFSPNGKKRLQKITRKLVSKNIQKVKKGKRKGKEKLSRRERRNYSTHIKIST